MTLAPPERPALFDARTIDMRCAATAEPITAEAHPPGALRCQLLAGHGGPHALMFADDTTRRVTLWSTADGTHVTQQDWRGLPWMRGLPVPAWFAGSTTADA